jgi:hypothetical protein
MLSTRFIIWFHQRSGSTHLRSMLDSHPRVTCWPELFFKGEANSAEDYYTRSGRDDVASFINDIFSCNISLDDRKALNASAMPYAIGFKLKYQQLRRHVGIADYFRQVSDIKVIHLIRKNLLATHVSSQMIRILFERFQRCNFTNEMALEDLDRTVELNLSTLVADLDAIDRSIQNARAELSHLDGIECYYEDIVSSHSETCQRLLGFIGVDPRFVLNSKYQKIMPYTVRESIRNFDQVFDVLRGTRFQIFLD